MLERRDEGMNRARLGYIGSGTAFGLGNLVVSCWMVRGRLMEGGRPIDHDEGHSASYDLAAVVTLVGMSAGALWRYARRSPVDRGMM